MKKISLSLSFARGNSKSICDQEKYDDDCLRWQAQSEIADVASHLLLLLLTKKTEALLSARQKSVNKGHVETTWAM